MVAKVDLGQLDEIVARMRALGVRRLGLALEGLDIELGDEPVVRDEGVQATSPFIDESDVSPEERRRREREAYERTLYYSSG